MRDYEVVYIFDSALDRSAIDRNLERFNQLITTGGTGEIKAVDHWGKRQLAYPVKKQEAGYYVVVQFRADPTNLDEFQRVVKLEESVLRHLVVLSEGPMPPPGAGAGARSGRRGEAAGESEGEEE